MAKPIRAGIIGASAEGGWALEGHVPAVQRLDGLEFAAVATNSQKTADASAKAFGVPAAYANGMDLIRAPGIDLVTAATRLPAHRELVLAALAAGKHVYCEWPLGRGTGEAEEMAAAAQQAAQAAGVHVAIGLQLRGSPAVMKARTLIASGTIGRVLSVSVYSATAGLPKAECFRSRWRAGVRPKRRSAWKWSVRRACCELDIPLIATAAGMVEGGARKPATPEQEQVLGTLRDLTRGYGRGA